MKVLIQNFNCKFINNLDSLSTQHQTFFVDIKQNIYQLSQKIVPNIYVFIAEKMSYEELHFCYNNTKNQIIIYNHNNTNIDNSIKNLDHISILNYNSMPILYNPIRYKQYGYDNDRHIEYSYFLDNDKELDDTLKKLLLPNDSKLKIKLFNNNNIEHPQNLGFLTEDDKCVILNKTINYICNNMFYAIEAHLSGCKVLDTNLNILTIDINNYQTYEQFFESILCKQT